MLGLGLILAVFAKMNLATMRVLEFYAKVPYWLVIITQHGLAGRLVYELPCEARFCTMSRAKRSKQQPRSLLVITMLHCKRGTRARFCSGQLRPSVEQLRPYWPRENLRALEKATPLYGGRGGHNFVDLRIVLLPRIRPSASVDFEAWLFDIGCLFVCLFVCFVCLFVCLLV